MREKRSHQFLCRPRSENAELWFCRAVACFLVLVLVLFSAPILDATESGIQSQDEEQTAGSSGSESEEESKEAKKKKGPSLIPIPIFITEPAIG